MRIFHNTFVGGWKIGGRRLCADQFHQRRPGVANIHHSFIFYHNISIYSINIYHSQVIFLWYFNIFSKIFYYYIWTFQLHIEVCPTSITLKLSFYDISIYSVKSFIITFEHFNYILRCVQHPSLSSYLFMILQYIQ